MENRIMERIKREQEFLDCQEVGSDEYCQSIKRLAELEDQLRKTEESEIQMCLKSKELSETKKGRITHAIIESVKVIGGIVLPIVGLIGITAVEKDITFTGSLRDYTKYFLPKK